MNRVLINYYALKSNFFSILNFLKNSKKLIKFKYFIIKNSYEFLKNKKDIRFGVGIVKNSYKC